MNHSRKFAWLLLWAALAGCSKKVAEEAPVGVEGVAAARGTAFAYEHRVGITLPASALSPRMLAVREACTSNRHGDCHLLGFETRSGGGTVRLRVAPAGVEPLVALAGEGGETGESSTTAEDLAPATENLASARDRLQRQRDALAALPLQATMSVADHVALSGELARIDSELGALERSAAQVARRVETNLLTIGFDASEETSVWSTFRNAFADAPESFADGISEAITWVAFLLPILLVAFPVALLWRALWRRATRAARRVD